MTKVIQAHNSGILSLTATSQNLTPSPLLFHSLYTPWLYHPSLPISPHGISDSHPFQGHHFSPLDPGASAPGDAVQACACDDEDDAHKEAHQSSGQAQGTDQGVCSVWQRRHLRLWKRKEIQGVKQRILE